MVEIMKRAIFESGLVGLEDHQRATALLSLQGGLSFSLWRGGVGCFIGALLCPIVSAVLAAL